MTDRYYPKPGRFFAATTGERPIFQGDIFRGAFGAWWRHPHTGRAVLAGETPPPNPPFPTITDLTANVNIQGRGYAMILPQPCDYSETEKGATHPFRLVAPLFPLDRHANVDPAGVRNGAIGHTFWVPRWTQRGPQDYFVDLRLTTSVDATFVRRDTRVASLSRASWLALADRLSTYFVGIPLDAAAFAVTQG
ncbi:MAG: hypothetical protein WCP28_09830, partial [Actinomycetes bacterium]